MRIPSLRALSTKFSVMPVPGVAIKPCGTVSSNLSLRLPCTFDAIFRSRGRDVLACDILIDYVHWYSVEIKHWIDKKPGKREAGAFFDTTLREGRGYARHSNAALRLNVSQLQFLQ